MKKLLLALTLVSGLTQAATLTSNFVDDNGKVFTSVGPLSFSRASGVITIRQATGGDQYFADASGNVWSKLINSTGFLSNHVYIAATNRYMTTTGTTEISCISNQTVFAYPSTAPAEYFADNCALQTTVKNASN